MEHIGKNSLIMHSIDGAETRIFNPPLHLQRYSVVAALTQKLLSVNATSLLDVGSSTCDFGKFILSPLDLASSLLHHYHAIDVYRGAVETGACHLEEELRASTTLDRLRSWVPKRASLYCASVFDIPGPNDDDDDESHNRGGLAAPHAECIVSLDVVEHIPLRVKIGEEEEEIDGPAAFLDWVFHTAPCHDCTKAVIVTTPNSADNVPVLRMKPGEMRHNDHKFEWNLEEMYAACKPSLDASSFAAWFHFGIGGTASQGVMALQADHLATALTTNHGGSELLRLFALICVDAEKTAEFFNRAQDVFRQESVYGKLLSFDVIKNRSSSRRSGSTSVVAALAAKQKVPRHPKPGAELVHSLDFGCVANYAGDGIIGDSSSSLSSSSVIWKVLFDLVLRVVRRLKAQQQWEAGKKDQDVVVEQEDKEEDAPAADDDEDDDDAESNNAKPTTSASELVWSTATAAATGATDDNCNQAFFDDDEEEEKDEEVAYREETQTLFKFSPLCADSIVVHDLASVSLLAVMFYFVDELAEEEEGDQYDENRCALPKALQELLLSDKYADVRALAKHLRFATLAGEGGCACPKHRRLRIFDRGQVEKFSQEKTLLSIVQEAHNSPAVLEDLLWAAVDGYFDGAVLDETSGERCLLI